MLYQKPNLKLIKLRVDPLITGTCLLTKIDGGLQILREAQGDAVK